MANTTFNGPVRSENGFETISKNATTGVVTITSGSKMATEALAGAGIEGTAETYITQVERFKSDTTTNVNLVKTTLMIDLTGLASSSAIGDLTETQIINGGDASVGTRTAGGTIVADQYLYLVSGDATDAVYTAGRLVITILGYDVAS